MRILYVTTVGSTMDFFKELIRELINDGHTVDIATNVALRDVDGYFKEMGCKIYSISFLRSPLKIENIKAVKEIRGVVIDGKYDVVHCHTPVASLCARLACNELRKRGLKVIYTAHGFHFYKGSPLKNWLMYYPVEWICAHWTDILITINQEDYALAQKHMNAKQIKYVPGVGIDTSTYSSNRLTEEEKKRLKKDLGISDKAKVFLSVGELSTRKNHGIVIKALTRMGDLNYKYLIVGRGELKDYLENIIHKHGLDDKVQLLGYRNDIPQLCNIADVFIFPSLQEGLPVALMEAIASKTKVICSEIRGNTDLISDHNILFSPFNEEGIISSLSYILNADDSSIEKNYSVLLNYDINNVLEQMKKIYCDCESEKN